MFFFSISKIFSIIGERICKIISIHVKIKIREKLLIFLYIN